MSLFRSRWLQIFLLGIVVYILANITVSLTGNVLFFPTVMMIGAFLVPVTFVAYFYQQESLFDRGAHAGSILPTLLTGALFAGLIGTLAAGSLESATLSTKNPSTLLWVGPIEEFAKLIVPVIIYFVMRRRFRSELDGVLFGVAAGMSFAALETMGYELVALVGSKGSLMALDQTILIRGLISPAGHAAWTGLLTATLWRERERKGHGLTMQFIGFFLLAAALHSIWDFVSFSAGSFTVVISVYILIGGISLALLFWRLAEARKAAAPAHVEPS
jgi:protease PrsW